MPAPPYGKIEGRSHEPKNTKIGLTKKDAGAVVKRSAVVKGAHHSTLSKAHHTLEGTPFGSPSMKKTRNRARIFGKRAGAEPGEAIGDSVGVVTMQTGQPHSHAPPFPGAVGACLDAKGALFVAAHACWCLCVLLRARAYARMPVHTEMISVVIPA
jgi:hypothetical protein